MAKSVFLILLFASFVSSSFANISFDIIAPMNHNQTSKLFSAAGEKGFDLERSELAIDKKNMFLRWRPDGSYLSTIEPECHFRNLEKLVYDSYINQNSYGKHIQAWVDKCQESLYRFRKGSVSNLLRFSNIIYDINESPGDLFNVRFTFKEGIKLRGILGLKNDGKARPFVIVKCGIYCDAEDGGVIRSMFMHIFETSPFNILFLANLTGEQYILDNKVLGIGGFDAGAQVVEIAHFLRSKDFIYRDLVSDVHVLGISLGGNAALYSALYQTLNSKYRGSIQSVIAICPVVNLKESLESVFEPNLKGLGYALITNRLIRGVTENVPILRDFFDLSQDWWSRNSLKESIEKFTLEYYVERTKNGWDLSPFRHWRIRSLQDFWQVNSFTKYYEGVRIPTMLVYADDDFMVRPSMNTKALEARLQLRPNPFISTVGFKKGSHCAFNVAHGWASFNSLLRSYFIKHSSQKQAIYRKEILPIESMKLIQNLYKKGKSPLELVGYNFRARKKKDYINLELKFFVTPRNRGICRTKLGRHTRSCQRSEHIRLPLSIFSKWGVTLASTKNERDRLSRWFNTSVSLLTKDGSSVLGTRDIPAKIEVLHDFHM